MEFLAELGLFALKTLIIVGGIIVVLAFLVQTSVARKHKPQIEVEKLNHRFRFLRRQLQRHLLAPKKFKSLLKDEKKADKKDTEPRSSRVFVLEFQGDVRATAVESLREEITAILSVAKPGDEVVVRLESGGGLVTAYGLAASQLERIKAHGLRLTICVDKIAASGGYMMACVAHRVLAAPFAVLGSIGVIAQVPNFNRVLKKNDIDYREITAGEFKRTISIFGEITETGMEKFRSQIEDTHGLFKAYVSTHRPQLDLAKVATGEYWYGTQARDLGLVDELMTSDEYLHRQYDVADVYSVKYHPKRRLMDKLSEAVSTSLHSLTLKLWTEVEKKRLDH
jgi:serine protease SohB